MIDQAAPVINAIQTAASATTAERAALLAQLKELTVVVSQLVQIGGHASTGGMTAHVIEWLKGKPAFASFWDRLSRREKVIAGLVAAALPASGIVLTFQHPGDGHWILDFDHLTATTAGVFAWSIIQGWFMQQAYYQAVLKPKAVTGPTEPQQSVVPVPVVVTKG